MPTPVTPPTFKDLIPRFQSSMCGKFIPTITNFIRRFVEFYEWMFNEDGSFTDDFKADLCALGCTAVPICPELNLAPVMVGRNEAVDFTWTVSGPVPYDYELFRATSPSGPWTSILADSGITDSTLTLTDDVGNDIATAPTNGVAYYYKLVVSKTDCADVEYITGSVTPSDCYVNGNDFVFELESGVSSLTVKLAASGTTSIPDGTAVEIWRSTVSDAIGTQINTGTFAGGSYTYADPGLTIGTRYYYTVKVQQSGGCTQFTLPAKNATVQGILKLITPKMDSDNNGIVIYGSGTVKFPDEYLLNNDIVVWAVASLPGDASDVFGQISNYPYPTTFPNPALNTTIPRAVKLNVAYDNSNIPGKWSINLMQLPENGTDPNIPVRDYFIGIILLDATENYLPSNIRKFYFRTYQGISTVSVAGEEQTSGYATNWENNI